MAWFDVFKGANKLYSEFVVLRSEMSQLKEEFSAQERKQAEFIRRIEQKIEMFADRLSGKHDEFRDRHDKKEDDLRRRMAALEGLVDKTLMEAFIKVQQNQAVPTRAVDYYSPPLQALEYHNSHHGGQILIADLGMSLKIAEGFKNAGLLTIDDAMNYRAKNGDWTAIAGIGSKIDIDLLKRLESILNSASS